MSCCLLLLAGVSRAQDDSAKFRVNVNQIVVPVVVTDAKGHRVPGLKAESFEVFEDGALQKVLSFSMGGEVARACYTGQRNTSAGRCCGPAANLFDLRRYSALHICQFPSHSHGVGKILREGNQNRFAIPADQFGQEA